MCIPYETADHACLFDEARLSRETPVVFERLITLVPFLNDQGSAGSQPEDSLRRLLLDRLALALQHLAGT